MMTKKTVSSAVLAILISLQVKYANCQCSGVTQTLTAVTNTSNTLYSPGYPYAYSNNQNCKWLITTTAPNVYISFTYFAFERTHDNVYVYDGTSLTASQAFSESGFGHTRWVATGQNALVNMVTDFSVTSAGFAMDYIAYDGSQGCPGTVSSTNTPQGIAFTTSCNVELIATSSAKQIVLEVIFTRFVTTSTNEKLDIYDDTLFVARISNDFPVDPSTRYTISVGKKAVLNFAADPGVYSAGAFIQHWTVDTAATTVPPTPTVTTTTTTTPPVSNDCGSITLTAYDIAGEITSPGYPLEYFNNLYCSWTIYANDSDHYSVKLTVQDIELEANYDTVKVFDGPSTYYPLLASVVDGYSSFIIGSGHSIFLAFYTDGSVTFRGFRVSYSRVLRALPSCLPPTYTLIDVSTSEQFIESPGYPAFYSHGLSVYWILRKPSESDNIVFSIDSHIESASDCRYDSLTIYDGPCESDDLIAELCGNSINTYKDDSSFYHLVHFSTDGSVAYKGFQMKVYIGSYDTDTDTEGTDEKDAFLTAGIVVGVILLIALSSMICIYVLKRKQRVHDGTVLAPPKTKVKVKTASQLLQEIKNKPVPQPKPKIKRKRTNAYIQINPKPNPPPPSYGLPQNQPPAIGHDPAYPEGSTKLPQPPTGTQLHGTSDEVLCPPPSSSVPSAFSYYSPAEMRKLWEDSARS